MTDNHELVRTIRSRMLILPVIFGMVFMSVLVGYGSGVLWPIHTHPVSHPIQLTDAQLTKLEKILSSSSQDSGSGATSPTSDSDDPVSDYKSALLLLKKEYYGAPIDVKKERTLTYESIRGLLASLRDQFTSFLDPDEWSQFHATTRGDFEGIGALLEQAGAFTKIARPIEGGPAEKAGLLAEDVVVKVDGQSIKGKDINDVVHLIKGKRGTKVLVGILRGKKEMSFSITRALVEPAVVQHWMEDKQSKIGHIVLKEFNEKSVDQLQHAYDDLAKQNMKGLVLDLRYNPGGLLEVAIQVASMFIPKDQNETLNNVVVFIHEGSGQEQVRTLMDMPSHPSIPLVVLVNDGSASASEIVSGAIKDYGVGTLIGERTFGKGKVQTLFPLDDGSALRLTTALYFPPKHKDINFEHDEDGARIPGTGGIVPDIEIKQNPKWKVEDFKDKVNDLQLQKAVQFLKSRLSGLTTAQATQSLTKQ